MARVSVIIPTFNRERYVVRAVDSALRQTFKDRQVIVIDDGSGDNTRGVLAPYKDRIRYIHQKNSGVSAARNAGIREAQGEWISFLDSDDEWNNEYLATQMAQSEEHPRSGAHITNAVTISLDGMRSVHFKDINFLGTFGQRNCMEVERPLQLIMGYAHWFLQPTVIRRDILLQAGLFDPHLSIAEDLDLLARVAAKSPFTFRKDVLVEIYRREESIENLAAQFTRRGIYSRRAFGAVYTNLLKLEGLTTGEREAVERALSSNWRALGNLLMKSGRTSEARELYRKSLLLDPSARSLVKYLAAFLPAEVSKLFMRKGRDILPGEEPVEE